MTTQTRWVLIYVWAVVTAGALLLAGAALHWESVDPAAFLVCAGLAAWASTRKVALPCLTATITPGFVFLLLAAGKLSWAETVVIGVICGLVQCLWRPRKRPGLLQICFNVGTLSISAGLAHGVSHGLAVTGLDPGSAPLLGVAGVVLLVANTLLVSTVLCLVEDSPLRSVWRSLQFWSFAYYLAGGVVAGIWAQVPLTAGGGIVVFAALSVHLLDVCFSQWIAGMGSAGQPLSS